MSSLGEIAPSHPRRFALLLLAWVGLPVALFLLWSFGGQLLYGLPVGILSLLVSARLSGLLGVLWALTSGAHAGTFVYVLLDLYVDAVEGFAAVVIGLLVSASVAAFAVTVGIGSS